jgi:STE24 endopeptidase
VDEKTARAKLYSSQKRKISMAAACISLVYFIVLLHSGASGIVARFSYHIGGNIYLAALIYLMIIGLVNEIITFPFDYAGGFRIEHEYGLSRQVFSSWLMDYIKRLFIGSIVFAVMVLVFYFLIVNFESLWWLYAGIIFFIINVIIAKIFPMLIIPMFYRLTNISDTPLKESIKSLAEKAGVKVLDIYNIGLGEKTSKANAAVCGIGKSKRILLSDTLIQQYSQDEIEATMAHELSHHRHNHFWKLSAFNAISMFLFLFLTDIMLARAAENGFISARHDIAAFPAIAVLFLLFNLAVLPISNFISRAYETQADKDAIKLTGKAYALSALMRKLTTQNLSDPSPSLLVKIFFYSHPPAQERIMLADSAAKS